MRISDFIVEYLVKEDITHVFLVSGGANLPIIDALDRNPNIEYVCTLHEQAAAMAAEAYARVTGNIGTVVVTTGPGGTNAITGVLGAWQDSIPCLIISGQVKSALLEKESIRQLSMQGLDIIKLIKSITKYSVTITDPNRIKYHLQKALNIARSGRPGPVWLDIPLDISSTIIEGNLPSYTPLKPKNNPFNIKKNVTKIIDLIKKSERPIILVGTGVRLSRAEDKILKLIELLKIPFLCSWNIQDIDSFDNPLYMGSPGTFGTRYANFAVQNSDLLLSIGSRLSIGQTGHNYKSFARSAIKIVVDIDKNELEKNTIIPDIPIHCDANIFLTEMLRQLKNYKGLNKKTIEPWIAKCQSWKVKYPAVLPEYCNQKSYVNSYVFIDVLSDELNKEDIIVLANGTAFTCTFQAFKTKKGQRLFHSGGAASMGYGLPASIGACFGSGKKRTICITGDGSIQMNLQELETVISNNLPIKIFMINNEGYLAIRNSQNDWFDKRYAASSKEGGVHLPDIQKIAAAYGFKTEKINNHDELRYKIKSVLLKNGPILCEIMMKPDQPLIPYLSYRTRKDGSRYPAPLEDMYPFLDRKEFLENMLIKPWSEPVK